MIYAILQPDEYDVYDWDDQPDTFIFSLEEGQVEDFKATIAESGRKVVTFAPDIDVDKSKVCVYSSWKEKYLQEKRDTLKRYVAKYEKDIAAWEQEIHALQVHIASAKEMAERTRNEIAAI